MFFRGLLLLSLNVLFWGVVVLMEEIEMHAGHLPKQSTKSRPFWYHRDWYLFTVGELFGSSLLSFVVGYAYRPSHAPLVLVATFIGFLLTLLIHIFFATMPLKSGSHYPKVGVLSWNGVLHLGYFFWQWSFGAYLILLLLVGKLQEEVFAITILGILVYLASFAFDIHGSTLAPRKK